MRRPEEGGHVCKTTFPEDRVAINIFMATAPEDDPRIKKLPLLGAITSYRPSEGQQETVGSYRTLLLEYPLLLQRCCGHCVWHSPIDFVLLW